ncbi:MAG: ABC transporter ATP-binding protein [Rhodothermales bacterium]|nr:ABC transporter ATP-binding protein [Rhodothermales bacterium]
MRSLSHTTLAGRPLRDLLKRASYLTRALQLVWESSRTWTVLWLVLLVLNGVLPAASVYLTKVLIDGLAAAIGAGLSWEAAAPVLLPAALMAGILLLSQGLQSLIAWVRTAQAELIGDHIKALVHEQAGTIDLEYYETPAYYDQMARASGQAESRSLSLLQNLGGLLQHSATLLSIAALLTAYGLWLPFALLLSTLPALWVVVRHQRRHHDWWEDTTQRRRWAQYFDFLLTAPFYAGEVRVFGLNGRFQSAYRDLRRELREGQITLMRKQSVAQLGAGLLALLVMGGAMGWMGWRAFQGAATLGDIALFYQAFNQGQSLMRTLLSSVGQLFTDALFLEHLFTFLELEPKVTDPAEPVPAPRQLRDGIAIEDVSFRYPGSEQLALQGFNLFIPAGKIVAVVGPNGAGKSTLVKLLCRFYDPADGRVAIDGTDIRDMNVRALRQQVTALFQTHVNYAGTIADNITMGDVEAEVSPQRLREAAEAGGALGFIERLPEGFQTRIGKQFEGGVDLSGGQFQRLALARALYRPAPLLLLDEPTSFMDPWAEAAWLDRFCRHVRGRTVLMVTHRFSTAMRADLICVVDEGRTVEVGSHAELLRQNGLYAASWRAQMEAQADEADAPETLPFA